MRLPDPVVAPVERPAAPLTEPDAVPKEQERLRAALEQAARELESLAAETAHRAGEEIGAIFEAQALFARDPQLVTRALALIADERLSADAAFSRAAAGQEAILASLDDDYFRARAADVRDVAVRVDGILRGRAAPRLAVRDGLPAVLVGSDVDASTVALLRPELVAGIALAGGASKGHAAIVARALGVPLVAELGPELLDVPEGTLVAIDGSAGWIVLEPEPTQVTRSLPSTQAVEIARDVADVADRLRVRIAANAGSVREVEEAARVGALGVGLLRTELLFLGRGSTPGLAEQRALYRRVRAAIPGHPITFRTLDLGADKRAAYGGPDREANPALGMRGIRLGLAEPELLGTQLRALVEAAAGEPLRVMFPMAATLEELAAAQAVVEEEVAAGERVGIPPPSPLEVGIMVEVPAVALLADAFAARVDFLSVGTNDLAQYTMAADRADPRLAGVAVTLQPAVLRLVGRVVQAGAAARVPVSVCGEAAGDVEVAPILVGLGVETLSMAPASIPSVAALLSGLSLERCRAAAEAALAATSLEEVRAISRDAAL